MGFGTGEVVEGILVELVKSVIPRGGVVRHDDARIYSKSSPHVKLARQGDPI